MVETAREIREKDRKRRQRESTHLTKSAVCIYKCAKGKERRVGEDYCHFLRSRPVVKNFPKASNFFSKWFLFQSLRRVSFGFRRKQIILKDGIYLVPSGAQDFNKRVGPPAAKTAVHVTPDCSASDRCSDRPCARIGDITDVTASHLKAKLVVYSIMTKAHVGICSLRTLALTASHLQKKL